VTPEINVSLYWDANVFLNYLNGVPDLMPDLDALLDAAQRGGILILTSTLSIVEVAFAASEQLGGPMSDHIEAAINDLWMPPSPVRLVEFSAVVARSARSLMREARARAWSLKPNDAIHLATARQMGVAKFNTYERATLDKYGALCGFTVEPPRAAQPQLPLNEKE
jgi:predicted nucleic acid-binding protein